MERLSDLSSVKDLVSGRTPFVLLPTTVEAVNLIIERLRHASSLSTCKPLGCKQCMYWFLEGMRVFVCLCAHNRYAISEMGIVLGRFLEFPNVAKIHFTFYVKYTHKRSAISFFDLQNFYSLGSGEVSLFTHFCHVYHLNSLDYY